MLQRIGQPTVKWKAESGAAEHRRHWLEFTTPISTRRSQDGSKWWNVRNARFLARKWSGRSQNSFRVCCGIGTLWLRDSGMWFWRKALEVYPLQRGWVLTCWCNDERSSWVAAPVVDWKICSAIKGRNWIYCSATTSRYNRNKRLGRRSYVPGRRMLSWLVSWRKSKKEETGTRGCRCSQWFWGISIKIRLSEKRWSSERGMLFNAKLNPKSSKAL